MKTSKNYKPQLCASNDATRPVLCKLNIVKEHKGIEGAAIIATDGRRLIALPCELEAGDVPGIVRKDALSLAKEDTAVVAIYRAHSRKYRMGKPDTISLQLGADRVTTDATASYPRFSKDGKDKAGGETFPQTIQIVPDRAEYKLKFSLNPTYLLEMALAMGGKGDQVVIEVKTELDPFYIRVPGEEKAFGILMPMRAQ